MTHQFNPALTAESDLRVKLRVLPDSSRAEAMLLWRKLELDLQSSRLSCSSIWTETWLNHFGSRIPHLFMVGYYENVPCGICLITQSVAERNGPVRIRSWHIGTAGEGDTDSACVEYNAVLVHPQYRTNFIQVIWNWASTQSDWDEFRLDGLCGHELQGWSVNDKSWSIESRPTYYYDLAAIRGSDAEPLARLGPKTRSVIRQNLRRSGPVTAQWAESVSDAEEIFAELIVLHQARWTAEGLPGSYASKVFRDFHLELLHRLVPLGLMGLFRVSNAQGTIGCAQALIDSNRACMYQSGRVLNTDPHCSPGVILDYLVIEHCRKLGLDAVDFLAGETPHKRRLSTNSSALNWAVCRRPRLKHCLVNGLRSIKHAFLKTFQQTAAQTLSQPPRAALNEMDC